MPEHRATDAQLLARFLERNDNDAFSELVRRYSGLVLGVCQRTLSDQHAAEDAFQATFLVLARRASRVRRSSALGSWLYCVAYRTARRAQARRIERREQPLLREMTHTEKSLLAELARRHEQQLVDDELQQLPAKYREPLVLRYLIGKSNNDIASELGLALGVIEGRIKRGKDRLRQRLLRRGISSPLALAGLPAAADCASGVEPLIADAMNAAADVKSREPLPHNLSEHAVLLAEQELAITSSTLSPMALLAAITAVVAAIAAGQSNTTGQRPTPAAASPLTLSPAVVSKESNGVSVVFTGRVQGPSANDPAPAVDPKAELPLDEPTRPVLMVRGQRGFWPVASDGVLLPPTAFSARDTRNYLRAELGDLRPLRSVGSSFGYSAVTDSAKIAALLGNIWRKARLEAITVVDADDEARLLSTQTSSPTYLLLPTDKGIPIRWGHAPGREENGEVAAHEKLRRLRRFAGKQEYDFLPSQSPMLDLRPRTGAVIVMANNHE